MRKVFLRVARGCFCLSLISSAALTLAAPERPNVVLIFCDDLGYGDLGAYGSTTIKTPNLDRMSSEGVRLTQFYVTMPACSPSRASLLTGKYQLRVGIPNVLGPETKIGLRQNEWTIAEALKEQGYATACIGKWHLGHLPEFLPMRHGFDSYFGLPYSNDMDRSARGGPAVPLMEGDKIIEQPVKQDSLTQRYTERAVRFIRDNKDKRFFLYLPHTFPHVPLFASDQFRGKSAGGLYGDVVEEIDWSTGEILKTLRELGIDKSTLVLFSSDNGPWLIKGRDGGSAGPLREGKATVYEGGIRVPFIAWWPGGIPGGRVVHAPVISVDVFPTVLKLAGGSPGKRKFDGEDVMPVLKDDAARGKTEFAWYRGTDLLAVRKDNWKLHLPKRTKDTTAPMELYDLSTDLAESKNLAHDRPEIVEQLKAYADSTDKQIRKDFRSHPNSAEPDRISTAPAHIADPTSTQPAKKAGRRKQK